MARFKIYVLLARFRVAFCVYFVAFVVVVFLDDVLFFTVVILVFFISLTVA